MQQQGILVVESDPSHLALLTHVVKHKKLESRVKFCCDGRSTITYLSSGSSDVRQHTCCCIFELSLSDMHGAELVHLIRKLEQLQHVQFVVFSRSIDSLTEEHARILNGCRMVEKPAHALELQERFWEVLRSCNADPNSLPS